jgi:hypothetical protein
MHNIFDFVERDKKTYLPKQASTEIGKLERTLKIGRWRIPLERPTPTAAQVEAVLDHPRRERHLEHGPARADHLPARQVLRRAASAMMVPDLLGTLGTFLHYTTSLLQRRSRAGCAFHSSAWAQVTARPARRAPGSENSFREGNPPSSCRSQSRSIARAARRGSPSARIRSSSRRASSATG